MVIIRVERCVNVILTGFFSFNFFFAGSGCEKTCMCGTAMMHVLKLKLKIIQLGLKGQNRRQAIF